MFNKVFQIEIKLKTWKQCLIVELHWRPSCDGEWNKVQNISSFIINSWLNSDFFSIYLFITWSKFTCKLAMGRNGKIKHYKKFLQSLINSSGSQTVVLGFLLGYSEVIIILCYCNLDFIVIIFFFISALLMHLSWMLFWFRYYLLPIVSSFRSISSLYRTRLAVILFHFRSSCK